MSKSIKVKWDNKAKSDLRLIFEYISIQSPQGAKAVILDIVNQTKTIRFSSQFQVDDVLGEPYRRMIVRDYKIIYKVHSETEIRILQIFDYRQKPSKLKN